MNLLPIPPSNLSGDVAFRISKQYVFSLSTKKGGKEEGGPVKKRLLSAEILIIVPNDIVSDYGKIVSTLTSSPPPP